MHPARICEPVRCMASADLFSLFCAHRRQQRHVDAQPLSRMACRRRSRRYMVVLRCHVHRHTRRVCRQRRLDLGSLRETRRTHPTTRRRILQISPLDPTKHTPPETTNHALFHLFCEKHFSRGTISCITPHRCALPFVSSTNDQNQRPRGTWRGCESQVSTAVMVNRHVKYVPANVSQRIKRWLDILDPVSKKCALLA